MFVLFSISPELFAADLTPLTKGRNVHLSMVGHGPLCDAKVEERSPDAVTLRLLKNTAECGRRGSLIVLTQDEAVGITPEERLTKRRVVAKVLLGIGGVAALCALPLTSSDPENWLIVANGVLPGFILYGGWRAVPRRLDYVILMKCPDSLHCFSEANHPPL